MYNNRIAEFDVAMEFYRQRKYKEAEKILLKLLENNRRDKYLLFQMGKVRLQLQDKRGAENYFKECIKYFPNNAYPRLELGKIYVSQEKEKEAETEFKRCIEIGKVRAPHARLELGKLYVSQGKQKEAEIEFKKCIEIEKDRNPHARLELGKLYVLQGKQKEAETEFNKYIEIDKDRTPHARLELGRLYAIQGKDTEAEKMYSYILENADENKYSEENRIIHIMKHMKNDMTKSKHGVFVKDCLEVMNTIIKAKRKKQVGYMCDIYCVNVPECGYEGGKNGDGHILNYVTIITLPNSKQLITMFPSDEIIIEKNKGDIAMESVGENEEVK